MEIPDSFLYVASSSREKQLTEGNLSQWDQVSAIQKMQPLIYDGFAGAFASFFQTGDPNAHKLSNSTEPGVPNLTQQNPSEKFVIESTGFQNVGNDVLEKRCAFWSDIGPAVPV